MKPVISQVASFSLSHLNAVHLFNRPQPSFTRVIQPRISQPHHQIKLPNQLQPVPFSLPHRHFSTRERLRKLTAAQFKEFRRKQRKEEARNAKPRFICFGWFRVGPEPVRRLHSKDLRTPQDFAHYKVSTSKWEKLLDSFDAPSFKYSMLIGGGFVGLMSVGLSTSILAEWWFEPGTKPGWWSRAVSPEDQAAFEEDFILPLQGSVSDYAARKQRSADPAVRHTVQVFKDGEYIDVNLGSEHIDGTTLDQLERIVHYDDFVQSKSKPNKLVAQNSINVDDSDSYSSYKPDLSPPPSQSRQMHAQHIISRLPPIPPYPQKPPGVAYTDAELEMIERIKEMEVARDALVDDILGKNEIFAARARDEINQLHFQEQQLRYLESQNQLNGGAKPQRVEDPKLHPNNSIFSANYWLETFRLKPKHDVPTKFHEKGRWPGELEKSVNEFLNQQRKYVDPSELKGFDLVAASYNGLGEAIFNLVSHDKSDVSANGFNTKGKTVTVVTPEQKYYQQRMNYGRTEYCKNLEAKHLTANNTSDLNPSPEATNQPLPRKRTTETDIEAMVDQLYEHYTYDSPKS